MAGLHMINEKEVLFELPAVDLFDHYFLIMALLVLLLLLRSHQEL